jgi:hypothetical protein
MGDVHPAHSTHDTVMSTYRITVQGELGPAFARNFDGMTLQSANGATVIVGDIVDQAQLQGLLSRLGDLGLVLLEVSSGSAMHLEAQISGAPRPNTHADEGGRS